MERGRGQSNPRAAADAKDSSLSSWTGLTVVDVTRQLSVCPPFRWRKNISDGNCWLGLDRVAMNNQNMDEFGELFLTVVFCDFRDSFFSVSVFGVGVRRPFHLSLFLTASRMVLPKILVLRLFDQP